MTGPFLNYRLQVKLDKYVVEGKDRVELLKETVKSVNLPSGQRGSYEELCFTQVMRRVGDDPFWGSQALFWGLPGLLQSAAAFAEASTVFTVLEATVGLLVELALGVTNVGLEMVQPGAAVAIRRMLDAVAHFGIDRLQCTTSAAAATALLRS